ncbi:MAG: STAS domain-containing protein [Proteobacteria bacterium]|nr:STAS domain-containing protein [Pseudomonadota bacterium]MCG2747400.1 STAS domain-containing protein [Desulfobulbaceae bacterium]
MSVDRYVVFPRPSGGQEGSIEAGIVTVLPRGWVWEHMELLSPITINEVWWLNMDEQLGKKEDAAYKIEGDLTIYQVAELRERLLPFASGVNTVTVDLLGVAECDAAGLQLLVSLKKTAEEAGKQFLLMHLPDSVTELMRELGFEAVCPVD